MLYLHEYVTNNVQLPVTMVQSFLMFNIYLMNIQK